MPTYEHELPLRLLQDNPKFAEELYCGLLGQRLPEHTFVKPGSEAMTRGDSPVERNCDNIAVYYSGDDAVMAVIFEVQRSEDNRKHFSWLDYLASARTKLQCPAALVVITFDDKTAAWARQPIVTGHPGLTFIPLVISPQQIPLITDAAEGRENLALMLLSLIAHSASEHGRAVMTAYSQSIRHLDREEWSRYAEYALNALKEQESMQLEEIILSDSTLPNTYRNGLLGEKYLEGRSEGRSEGRLEGERQMLLLILESRGFDITPEVRELVESCDDVRRLQECARRALAARRIEMVFDLD